MSVPGVDMNDPANLSNYHDILLFKSVNYEDALVYSNPSHATQRVLQAIAHSLDLEYEYSLATRNAQVTRRTEPSERGGGSDMDMEDEDVSINRVQHRDDTLRSVSRVSDLTVDNENSMVVSARKGRPSISSEGMEVTSPTSSEPRPFRCRRPDCEYQGTSQRLLDRHTERNHADDDSRLFFCPIAGCPRSRVDGGKGFKYKYSIALHEYTHNSPGYICPFCIEEVHKYNRPDILLKHVSSKHPKKSADDSELTDILAARPNMAAAIEASTTSFTEY